MTTLQTPVGAVVIEGHADAVTRIIISAEQVGSVVATCPADSPVLQAAMQLRRYFDGTLRSFDLPLVPLTSLRGEALRAAIASVPYGERLSYGALAKAHDSGARAVGAACARNTYPIVIPCHRIISSAGASEYYSGGRGPITKAWLNAHEARHSGRTLL